MAKKFKATERQMFNRLVWLAALEDERMVGAQAKHTLTYDHWTNETVSFCCLGVAEVCRRGKPIYGSTLTPAGQEWLGLQSDNPSVLVDAAPISVAELNDKRDYTFKDIAKALNPYLLDPHYNGKL